MAPDPAWINLAHALTIVGRLAMLLARRDSDELLDESPLHPHLVALDNILGKYAEEEPPVDVSIAVAERAAAAARRLAEEMVGGGIRGDRLGQCVRNLFECLGEPAEGAALSLQCGERADSPLRP